MYRVFQSAIARMRADQLDRRLCAGEDPVHDALLAARAAQLGGRRERLAAAAALQRALDDAATRRKYSRYSLQVPVSREEVLEAAPTLESLIERLRDGWPAWPTGVAHVRRVITDGSGPLYVRGAPGDLARRARRARDELDRDIGLMA